MTKITTISAKKTARFFICAIVGFLLASITGTVAKYLFGRPHLTGLTPLFNVDTEANIPTWYSSSALLVCAALLALIAMAKKAEQDQYTLHWSGLSTIFLLLSVDEAVVLHERLIAPVQSALGTSGIFHFAWVIPMGICVIVLLLLYLRFLAALPAQIQRLFLLAGAIYVSGTIGFEMIGAPLWEYYGRETLAAAILTTIEEALEMIGVAVFIYALLSYISLSVKEIRFSADS